MIPSVGPESWRQLLADPDLHWAKGRSARTMAHAWEDADGWPDEVKDVLTSEKELAGFVPTLGFPEYQTALPGGDRPTQTDLMVLANDGDRRATVAVEGKVDEPFGPLVDDWLGDEPSLGKRERLSHLADLLALDVQTLGDIRYQLLHRTAAAKIEAHGNGSDVAIMLVHSWAANEEGWEDYTAFCLLLGVDGEINRIGYSESGDIWLAWVKGNPVYLTS